MSTDDDILLLFDEMLLVERQAAKNTRRAYKSDIHSYIKFINAKYSLSILNVENKNITSWYRSLSEKSISRNSYLRKVSSIKEFYRFLYADGLIKHNPAKDIESPKKHQNIPKVLTIRQIEDIINGNLDQEDNPLTNAPHTAQVVTNDNWANSYSRNQAAYPAKWLKEFKYWPSVGRVDNAFGDRNLICTCPTIEDYENE